jgi:ABC-2 type transport system permease protein
MRETYVQLKGIGFSYLLGQVSALLIFSLLMLGISTSKFKKKLD